MFVVFQCSVSCGRGSQTRLVHCLDELTQELSTGCDRGRKPDSQNICVKPECPKPGILLISKNKLQVVEKFLDIKIV